MTIIINTLKFQRSFIYYYTRHRLEKGVLSFEKHLEIPLHRSTGAAMSRRRNKLASLPLTTLSQPLQSIS